MNDSKREPWAIRLSAQRWLAIVVAVGIAVYCIGPTVVSIANRPPLPVGAGAGWRVPFPLFICCDPLRDVGLFHERDRTRILDLGQDSVLTCALRKQ